MATKRFILSLIFLALSLLFTTYPAECRADVDINVGINVLPPAFVIPSPPAVMFVPGTYVYFIPGIEADILFYHGYWYRPYKGHWYRAGHYNGPWGYLAASRVPHVLLNLPPGYRSVPPGHQHIPYGHLKKNWKKWEREKYWERHYGKEWHKGEKRGQKEGKGGRKK